MDRPDPRRKSTTRPARLRPRSRLSGKRPSLVDHRRTGELRPVELFVSVLGRGDRLQATALDVLERLVEATYTRDRRRHLTAANLGIGGWRKAHEAAQG